jgi:tRNA threonylcarbamoyladenosine biosynthesis protein TsaE
MPVSTGPEDTRAIGEALASRLAGGDLVLLRGDLGAGKTTFAQGIGRGLGVAGVVQSPTFTLIAEYPAPVLGPTGRFVHVDLYRVEGGAGIASIGLDEYFDRDDCVTVIEWPDRARVDAYPAHWSVHFDAIDSDRRAISIAEPADG